MHPLLKLNLIFNSTINNNMRSLLFMLMVKTNLFQPSSINWSPAKGWVVTNTLQTRPYLFLDKNYIINLPWLYVISKPILCYSFKEVKKWPKKKKDSENALNKNPFIRNQYPLSNNKFWNLLIVSIHISIGNILRGHQIR